MHRHLPALWGLLAILLLAACTATQGGAAPSTTPIGRGPATLLATSAPAPTAAPSTSAPAAPTSTARTAAPASSGPTAAGAAGVAIQLEKVADDLPLPVFITYAGDESDRMFVVEKKGTISILRDGKRDATPFLDITSLVTSSGSEQGLLGLAFHPDYISNGRFFVYYTAKNGDDTLARYQVSSDPDVADPASGQVLFAVDDPAANHNGGMLAFGPDGYLYAGLGDGGSGGDPWGNAQNRSVLLGKLLRLDVDGDEPYSIPPDNPWPNGQDQARPEVWAYGLRNPWRFSFDRATGDLYIGDVGQNAYEEIDFQPAGSSGLNYGWNMREAAHCFRSDSCESNGLIDPIGEYAHDEGCSVTGGYVYRGAAFPSLQGLYIFGDYCSGRIWSLSRDDAGQWRQRKLLDSRLSISSFGEDQAGELYVVDLGGGLYRVTSGT
jgi:glucose/arabinose dehydrogenase